MAAPRITLGIIARDAGRTLRACLDSVAPYVDEIIIGLGGPSSDDTEQIVDEFLTEWASADHPERSATYFPIDWHDDFARARNEVLLKATGDYFMWLDADDILLNGALLRDWIARNPQANCFWAAYHYEQDEHGNVSCTLWRERLVKDPATWTWEGAVHEFMRLADGVPLELVQMTDVVVRHNPLRDRDKGTRNLDILYRELERTEPTPPQRLLLYLYRENAARGNLREALLHANRYISQATFDDEAYQMAYGIADTLRVQRRFPESAKAAMRAISINATWPDAYYLLARIAYEQGDFTGAVEWSRAAATKEPPQTSTIIDPRTYSYWPPYFLGLAYRGLGDHEMALANLRLAAKVVPDAQILALIAEQEAAQDGQAVLDHFMALYERLGRHDEWLKARDLFRVVPKELEQHPAVRKAHLDVLRNTAQVDDPHAAVKFYTEGTGWTPLPTGMALPPSYPRVAFARKSGDLRPAGDDPRRGQRRWLRQPAAGSCGAHR